MIVGGSFKAHGKSIMQILLDPDEKIKAWSD